ncbi:hypothetical protein QBC36DRAFT_372384 [Triangularia setosa]|uniref:Uncharacterized protein n=1 Tax=Triangularia setosa TaxID=2587417 RepID=A0AAN6W8H8_9PEZI|nr:hypothetical protein QBC36DRAFT_372384 [Podospora setosa]
MYYMSREKLIVKTRPDEQPIATIRPWVAERVGRYSGGLLYSQTFHSVQHVVLEVIRPHCPDVVAKVLPKPIIFVQDLSAVGLFSRDSFGCGDRPHLLQHEADYLNRESSECVETKHFVFGTGAGIRSESSKSLHIVPSVHWDEISLATPAEFHMFGEHAPRLHSLPRLLDNLFVSAGEKLMGPGLNISRINAKLRFITRCAGSAPHLAELVAESQKLLDRLELPKTFHENEKPFDDYFFVPQHPMADFVQGLKDLNTRLERKEDMAQLRKLIRDPGKDLMDSIGISIGTAVTEVHLDHEAEHAADATETVKQKVDDLHHYKQEMEDAKSAFDKGITSFKRELEQKRILNILTSVVQVGASVGAAIYTGDADTPLTIGTINQFLGRQVHPPHQPQNRRLRHHLPHPRRWPSLRMHRPPRPPSLLASWGEIDVLADLAFSSLRTSLQNASMPGLDAYNIALKNLVIRGDTLVTALKEARDARVKYLGLVAEKRAKDAPAYNSPSLAKRVWLSNIDV